MAYTSIDDPSAHFQVATYTGDGNDNRQVTNDGNSDLKPDWVWLKDRTQAESNALFDSTRCATIRLQSNTNGAESTESATLKSFTTDGFTLGTSGTVNNGSNPDQYVAWQWKANGGTTSTNSDGSEDSTVQANTTAGFSIVTFTANGSTNTYGHGLGVKPDIVLAKSRGTAGNWNFITDIIDGSMDYLILNSTNTAATIGYDAPTSSVFSYNDNNGNTTVVYCFAQKQGYSKFGKYLGTGNANGSFIYTGFKPKFVMVKETGNANSWWIFDTARDTYNTADARLVANTADAEATGSFTNVVDFLSNGLKFRNSDSAWNGYNRTYVYMCFAENPFVSSDGVPTTAR